jgi:WD40 repeat protein
VDAESGDEVASLCQERKFFQEVAFTPDGQFLAAASNEETVKFWDARTWKLAAEFAWQAGGLRCLAFSADGMLAAAGGTGRKVVVWDVDL